ncbi:MAG: DUF6625 family protein [Leuconostoc mesenteroides]
MVRNKCVFIIPYFGKFNNYFQLFLNSAGNNPDFSWIIFTDDHDSYKYPENVDVHYLSFSEFKILVQKKFDFEVSIEYPYRIADFRPAFGYIFNDYIQNYDFWGYCDCDLIFGRLSYFWNDDILEKNDKVGMLGHASLIRNKREFNESFMKSINKQKVYKNVLTENRNHSFDEEFNNSINNIFMNQGYRTNFEEYQANTYTKSSNFFLTQYDFYKNSYHVVREKNLFIYIDGHVFSLNLDGDGEIVKKEYLYIHFQSRKMKNKVTNYERFKMIPNAFEDINTQLKNKMDFLHEKKKHVNLHYFQLRTSNLLKKIKKRMRQ